MGTYLPRVADAPPEYVAVVCSRIHYPKSFAGSPKFCACSLSKKISPHVLSAKILAQKCADRPSQVWSQASKKKRC